MMGEYVRHGIYTHASRYVLHFDDISRHTHLLLVSLASATCPLPVKGSVASHAEELFLSSSLSFPEPPNQLICPVLGK